MAEGAVEGAADLAGDAQRARLADIRDIHAFAFDTGREAGQPFLRAVLRDLVIGDFRPVEDVFFGQTLAQFLGDIGHHREITGSEMVNPAAQLLGAHPGLFTIKAKAFHLGLEGRDRQSRQCSGAGRRRWAPGKIEGRGHRRAYSMGAGLRKTAPNMDQL